ncbi:MAG: CheR family methyltransferase [Myxococcota bacterium]
MRSTAPSRVSGPFETFAAMVKAESGLVLTEDKRVFVETRLQRWVEEGGFRDLDALLEHLMRRARPPELSRSIELLATHTTSFFREAAHFDLLISRMVPASAERLGRHAPLKVWSAACSTGEEPYSLAMCLAELEDAAVDYRVLATDLSHDVLTRARRGLYSATQADGVPPDRRKRWFREVSVAGKTSFKIQQGLRRKVGFHTLNLVRDDWRLRNPLDIIFCRNVLIYFDIPTRLRVVERLLATLAPGGYLVLGHTDGPLAQEFPLEPIGPTAFRYLGPESPR